MIMKYAINQLLKARGSQQFYGLLELKRSKDIFSLRFIRYISPRFVPHVSPMLSTHCLLLPLSSQMPLVISPHLTVSQGKQNHQLNCFQSLNKAASPFFVSDVPVLNIIKGNVFRIKFYRLSTKEFSVLFFSSFHTVNTITITTFIFQCVFLA
jgi:hypothetical protein